MYDPGIDPGPGIGAVYHGRDFRAMATSTRQRNNTIAGTFVLVSVVGFVIVIYLLSNLSGWRGSTEYTARFPLDLGVPGLQAGSDVTVGGVRGGSVVAVNVGSEPVESSEDGGSTVRQFVMVRFRLGNKFPLTSGARVGLVLPLIGSGTTLNIDYLGFGTPLAKGEILPGRIAESLLLKSAGIDVVQVKAIMDDVEVISEEFKGVLNRFHRLLDENGDEIIVSARLALTQISDMVDRIRTYWEEWLARVDRISANVDEASRRAPDMLDEAREVMSSAKQGIDEIRAIVAEARPDLKTTIDNIREATAHINSVTMLEVDGAIASGKEAIDHANTVIGRIDEGLVTRLPEVSRVLGNMRIASHYLKLAMIEIRSQPWRLLYTPTRNEVAESQLHDAVRTYAAAVSDLDATMTAIEAMHARYGDTLDPESVDLKLLLTELKERFAKYEEGEQRMFDELLKQADGKE